MDLGQNINGWVRLSRLGAAGTEVTLVYGESLDADGEVTQDHLRPIDFKNPGQFLGAGQVDSVISAGASGEVFEPRHTTHGFRYVSVRGLAEDLTPADIVACMVQTDLERLGTFSCSDGRLNRLHEIVEWSFRGNACEVPTDCPQREKAGWTGDWQLFVPTAAYLFDVAGFSGSGSTMQGGPVGQRGHRQHFPLARAGGHRCRIHGLHERVLRVGRCDRDGPLGDPSRSPGTPASWKSLGKR